VEVDFNGVVWVAHVFVCVCLFFFLTDWS
jgi:hypothetical protein